MYRLQSFEAKSDSEVLTWHEVTFCLACSRVDSNRELAFHEGKVHRLDRVLCLLNRCTKLISECTFLLLALDERHCRPEAKRLSPRY